MISQDTIEEIKSRSDIVQIIGSFVELKRSGSTSYKGLCPFHNEKTPSFSVDSARQTYHCFGCGKGGNAVNFITDIEQCSYVEALRQLAKKYHIEIEERKLTAEEKQKQDDRESMLVVNDFANQWFQDQKDWCFQISTSFIPR